MANIPQKGPAVRASKPGATSGVAYVSRIPISPSQVRTVGRLVSLPAQNFPAAKPLQPKNQLLSDEQRLHHQPGALSNGKSPACMSPVPGRLPDKHPVGRLVNAAFHVSPVAKSPREGQQLSKKRLREFCKHILEGIEALPTTPQTPSRQQVTPNTGAHNGEESGDAALHGKGGCGPSMARGDSPQLPDDVPVSPVGPERAVPSRDPGPLSVLHSRCAPWEQADHGSPGQDKGGEPRGPGAVDSLELAGRGHARRETPVTRAVAGTFQVPSPLYCSPGGPCQTSTPTGQGHPDSESSCLGNSPLRPVEAVLPPLPTPDFARFGRVWQGYWPSKRPFASADSASQESSLHGPHSASSGSAVAVPLPDSPPHYTEAGPSTSGSPDFVRPPMVTRRRRRGGRPTLATPPDHSMLRFTGLLASSPADMLPHGDFHGQEEEKEEKEESEGSLASSPWYLFSEPSQHSPALDQSPLPAKSPPSEPADEAEGPSNAAGRAFEWAIPLAPLPLDSSSPVLSSLHRPPLHHTGPRNRLSTVPEVTETTATALGGKSGTSTALVVVGGPLCVSGRVHLAALPKNGVPPLSVQWPTLEECSLLIDARQPWLVDTTFSSPAGPQQCHNEDKSSSAASPLSQSLLSFIRHEQDIMAEEAEETAAVAAAATNESE
ncbi:uncharacterized protein LOC144161486 isoform X1 [Haemaphysalis longicornis]